MAYSITRYWEPFSTHLPGMRSAPAALLWFLAQWAISLVFWAGAAVIVWFALVRRFGGTARARLRRAFGTPDATVVAALALLISAILYSMAFSVAIGVGVPRYRGPTDLLILAALVLGARLFDDALRGPGDGTEADRG